MLQLMPLLEAEGKAFAKKSLISIAGSSKINLNCHAILHLHSMACLFCSMHSVAKSQVVNVLLWTRVIKKALQLFACRCSRQSFGVSGRC